MHTLTPRLVETVLIVATLARRTDGTACLLHNPARQTSRPHLVSSFRRNLDTVGDHANRLVRRVLELGCRLVAGESVIEIR